MGSRAGSAVEPLAPALASPRPTWKRKIGNEMEKNAPAGRAWGSGGSRAPQGAPRRSRISRYNPEIVRQNVDSQLTGFSLCVFVRSPRPGVLEHPTARPASDP